MDKEIRNAIERATQRARKLLEEDFAAQLEGDFDVHRDGEVAAKAGKHLSARDAYRRERIVAAIEHKRAAGMSAAEATRDYLRDAAFTTLNRFVALKMLEARELVQECITKGEQSGGYREFCGMAPGLPLLPESAGYRLYIESLFDELSTEVKVLFDRRDPSSVLWPKRATFEQLLEILNATDLARVWGEDETIGWVYQFFNGQDERRKMREESQAPRNSRELAVRNQFFTPRYVVQFLTDNTLGRIWYEMRGTKTVLADKCEYMVRKPGETFAPRAKKDPRDLRVLDPACGSGHFLLYAFDLLLAIYEEAWEEQYAVCSRLNAVGSRQNGDGDGREELPGLDCVAEGDGSCGDDLRRDEVLSEGRDLWAHESSPQSGGVDPFERRGRPGAGIGSRVSSFPVDRAWIGAGGGDSGHDRSAPDVCERGDSPVDPGSGGRSGSINQRALEIALAEIGYDYSDSAYSPLPTAFPTLQALRQAVPGLALAHNLHGVDIDPRCAQIAQLALWMRAQKAYRDFGIGRGDRAQIRRSNIVVAEPLVADDQIAKEFVAKLGDAELGRVFTSLVESLSLAGDLGLLLRVEQLVKQPAKGQLKLLVPPEERIRNALDRFMREESATNTRRRLFGDDTAHGVALLGVAEKKFDAVLMNPPFGDGTIRARKELESSYPRTKNDIYAVFVERGIELLVDRGLLGAITSRTGFFLTSFQRWREDIILANAPPAVFADLGLGVMDAALVEAAAYCLERSSSTGERRTVFLRVLEELEDKALALSAAVLRPDDKGTHRRFDVSPVTFSAVPGSPFAYWVSDALRSVFQHQPAFEAEHREARQGLATADDFRFVRLWWEIAMRHSIGTPSGRWFPFAKGGPYSPFYFDLHLMVNWQSDGVEIVTLTKPGSDRPASRPQNTGYFSRPGLTWPRRTKSELSFRVMPSGCVFGDKGPAAFVDQDGSQALLATLALATSKAFRSLVEFQLAAADAKAGGAARSYEVGVIQRTPLARTTDAQERALAGAAHEAWTLKRALDSCIETSHAFALPDGPNARVGRCDRADMERRIAALQQEIDESAFGLYGIGLEDRAAIQASFSRASTISDAAADGEDEEEELGESSIGQGGAIAPIASWLVGVAFGRFDLRLATAERAIPPAPEPFDPLPTRSPGMYPEGEEPADRPDILVDDEGHADDLAARAIDVAERVKVDAPENLRAWLAKEFFPLHIRMYSKSRRKAPIYWQLATPSAGYSVWLYIHAFSKDTLFRVQNDYVAPKLAHEERRLESLSSELRDGATATQRKQLAAQEGLVEELRAFLDEVKRVAPLWKPNLDDGVIINFAPLWRLVPQNKSWQKELKSTWDALCEGKYDWAHLAMHLWPERVVPRCAKDRSLAIAHGLEDVFWEQGAGGRGQGPGKWAPKPDTGSLIPDLVRERTSPAVKSALKSLLEAPVPSGTAPRGRGGRRRNPASAGERGRG